MTRELVISGYRTEYLNFVYSKERKDNRSLVLVVSRYSLPTNNKVLNLIRREAINLTSASFDIIRESDNRKELRGLLKELPREGLEAIAQGKESEIEHLNNHLGVDLSGEVLNTWISCGTLDKSSLERARRKAENHGPTCYESLLYEKGEDTWNAKISTCNNYITPRNIIEIFLLGEVRVSNFLHVGLLKGNYDSARSGILELYDALGKDLDVSMLYDDTTTAIENRAINIIKEISACYDLSSRLSSEILAGIISIHTKKDEGKEEKHKPINIDLKNPFSIN